MYHTGAISSGVCNLFLERANFDPADRLQTPEEIAPVWYFTPYYAILRAVPNKLLGVILMGVAVMIFFLLPWLDRAKVKSIRYRGRLYKIWLALFVVSFLQDRNGDEQSREIRSARLLDPVGGIPIKAGSDEAGSGGKCGQQCGGSGESGRDRVFVHGRPLLRDRLGWCAKVRVAARSAPSIGPRGTDPTSHGPIGAVDRRSPLVRTQPT